MTNNDEKASFGRKLKEFREDTDDPSALGRHTYLTQIRFKSELNQLLNGYHSESIVQNWESDTTTIQPTDRKLLCGIIKVLRKFSGIDSRQQADELLAAGFYAQLSDEETELIDPAWLTNSNYSPRKKLNVSFSNPSLVTKNQPGFDFLGAPWPSSSIIGRQNEINVLNEYYCSKKEKDIKIQILVANKGRSGTGKFSVAVALANTQEIRSKFPDGILWSTLGSKPDIFAEMVSWIRAINTAEAQTIKSIEQAQARLTALLKEKQILLILDEVGESEHAVPFILSAGKECAVLVTTCFSSVATKIDPSGEKIVELSGLKDEDAIKLLEKFAPAAIHQFQDKCLELVRDLEGSPLAIQIAGQLLAIETDHGKTVDDFIEEFHRDSALLSAPENCNNLVKHTSPSIAAILYKCINDMSPENQDYFAHLGLFLPKPSTFDVAALEAVWNKDDPEPIIHEFIKRGMVEFIPEINLYRLHILIYLLAKSRWNELCEKKRGTTINSVNEICELGGNATVFDMNGPFEGANTRINQKLKINVTKPGSEFTVFRVNNTKSDEKKRDRE